jgi:Zinc finger, C3HC4 type (RING finger)
MATMSGNSSIAEPRPIQGTPGSRIRVILGTTGKDYLLLLNEDDGNTEWQKIDWKGCGSGFPNGVTKQINNCVNKSRYIKEVDFNASIGTWFVRGIRRDGTGDHSWWELTSRLDKAVKDAADVRVCLGSDYYRKESYVALDGPNLFSASSNIHKHLKTRLNRIKSRSNSYVKFVRLFDDSAYVISDDEGSEWCGLGDEFSKALQNNGTGALCDVSLAGDGSWIVIRDQYFVASQGVSQQLTHDIESFYTRQKNRNTSRQIEIAEFRAERERQAEQERLAQEAAAERERRAAEERERIERERMERLAREEEERLAREADELRERAQALERQRREIDAEKLVSQIEEDCIEIKVLEKLVHKRKLEVRSSIEALPPHQRARVEQATSRIKSPASHSKAECVICHDHEVQRALIPCGHHCLCDKCSAQLMNTARQCPLCREYVDSTLKIYSQI